MAGHELERPLADHADGAGRRPVLDQRCVAVGDVDDLQGSSDRGGALVVELGERMVLSQERHRLHGRSIARGG
jgi:hypothetical protein